MAFVASIRAQGVTQPAVVRPDGKNGYEIISGHRRDEGSKDAEIPYTPCIIRALNDEQAIQQIVEDNVNNREISTMELARALNMQLDSIKRQGARDALSGKDLTDDTNDNIMERFETQVKKYKREIDYLEKENAALAMKAAANEKDSIGRQMETARLQVEHRNLRAFVDSLPDEIKQQVRATPQKSQQQER